MADKIPEVELSSEAKELIRETGCEIQNRLGNALSLEIADLIKPLNESKIEYLEKELEWYREFYSVLSSSYIGLLAINRAGKKLSREVKNAGKQKIVKERYFRPVGKK